MTAQTMERIFINGRGCAMATEPLNSYISTLKEDPKFFSVSTDCWRGYYGTWEIKDNKLYLIDFKGYQLNKGKREFWAVGMDFLFPGQNRVFADWFTGELQIPEGDMLDYVHMGYMSTFELDLFIDIEKGIMTGRRYVDNLVEMAKELINDDKKVEPEIAPELEVKKKSFFNRLLGKFRTKK